MADAGVELISHVKQWPFLVYGSVKNYNNKKYPETASYKL
jgi:hypothetical protein